jgi:thymidylate kinase
MRPGSFYCLLGGDGSGKTTLLQALEARHPEIVTVHWKQIASVTLLPSLLPGLDGPETSRRLGPLSRAAQFCYLAALEYEMLIHPALAAGKTVIVDSYWYKFVGKMRVLDMAAPFLYEVCASLPAPGHILYLDTPLETSRARKGELNFFECAGRPDNFVPFQAALRSAIHGFITDIPQTLLDGRMSVADLVATVADLCSPAKAMADAAEAPQISL